MHPDGCVVDTGLVRRLLAAQHSELAGPPLRPVPSAGTDNALFRLGEDLVVRLPRIHWAVDAVAGTCSPATPGHPAIVASSWFVVEQVGPGLRRGRVRPP
jgi:hypothetical protein